MVRMGKNVTIKLVLLQPGGMSPIRALSAASLVHLWGWGWA